ncbi:F-box family protein [Rhynchospora pubera]|uniref:F-box family protein n=1 Tax=Rhynchospora pubera TaxID=906938 RepID=A0AAV8HCZ1_9POAL|nr:F-box family protein [Rhynchospora pubera]
MDALIQRRRRMSHVMVPRQVRQRQAATAMSCFRSKADTRQIDRLSNLPDELLVTILSFLPTPTAARTSVLCRRFRHLWEASPSVQVIYRNPDHLDKFVALADRTILHRNPSFSLLSLHLELYYFDLSLPNSYMPSLLAKAASLGLCHLTIVGYVHLQPILPIIFSIKTLKSLALPNVAEDHHHVFPSKFAFTSLTSLSLGFSSIDLDPPNFNQLLSELRSLEELQLDICSISSLIISSQTIRKLKLEISGSELHTLSLFLPSLESLNLRSRELFPSLHIHGEVPSLKSAVIGLDELHAQDVTAVTKLLNFISHLEELRLLLRESTDEKDPIHILLEPGKDVPNFPNLKHLYVRLCFHNHNFEDIIMMLHNCPVLESLKLDHKKPKITHQARGRKREDWCSKLPRRRNVNFRNLHLGTNKRKFMKLLGRN